MQNKIPYKGLVHNVLNDAPFIGAVVVANSCRRGCRDCINETLKDPSHTRHDSAKHIISMVKSNGLNEGVIFSGLEWSEQPNDLVELVWLALNEELKVMIYTHLSEETFFFKIPELKGLNLYVKFGAYLPESQATDYYSYSVKLASKNQYIKCFGI